jgi:hypothetical protein
MALGLLQVETTILSEPPLAIVEVWHGALEPLPDLGAVVGLMQVNKLGLASITVTPDARRSSYRWRPPHVAGLDEAQVEAGDVGLGEPRGQFLSAVAVGQCPEEVPAQHADSCHTE